MSIPWPGVLGDVARECGDDAACALAAVYGGREIYIPRRPLSSRDPLLGIHPLDGAPEQWIRKHYGGASHYVPKALYPRACVYWRRDATITVRYMASLLNISARTARRYRRSSPW